MGWIGIERIGELLEIVLQDFLLKILEWLLEWLRPQLTDLAKWEMSSIFYRIGGGFANIQGFLADTPSTYNATIYDIIKTAGETLILPIAMAILVIISMYELVMNVANTSNMKEFDIMGIIKWMLKFLFSLFVLSNTFIIVDGIFSVGPLITEHMLGGAGIITDITDPTAIITEIETLIDAMDIWQLIGFDLMSAIIAIAMWISEIILTVFMLWRFMEIYLVLSLAPIPMATFGSKEYSRIGENYIKTLMSYVLQVFLIILAIAIYTGMINASISDMISSGVYDSMAMVQLLAITIIMIMTLLKTKSVAREVLG